MKKIFLALTIMTAGALALTAQSEDDLFGSGDDLFGGSEDDLFGGSALVEDSSDSETVISDILLTNEEVVVIGGSYNMSLTGEYDITNEEQSLEPDMSAELYIDARPDSDIRVYGSIDLEYPFTGDEDIQISEFFSDFNFDETLFVRAGKQTINWGVGYFYSPADLLNLSEIDPENPDEDLEGPLSVKMNLPVGSDNYYLYTVFPEDMDDPSDVALAPKAEYVLGSTEVGLGAYYRYDQAPAAMATFTTALFGIDWFGEGVVKYGSDKTFVVEDGGSYSLETYDDSLFFLATIGGSWSWSDDESDLALSVTGQYYYNGEGYADRSVFTETAGKTFVAASYASGDLNSTDLIQSSLHYAAANTSLTVVEDLSVSVYWMGNFTDFSGLVKPSVNWNVSDYFSLNLGFPCYYGDEGDEYTPAGDSLSASLTVSLGGTSF